MLLLDLASTWYVKGGFELEIGIVARSCDVWYVLKWQVVLADWR